MAFAGRARPKHMLMILVLCMVIGWPLYQLMDLKADIPFSDAAKLLHEVALFQLEMLVGSPKRRGWLSSRPAGTIDEATVCVPIRPWPPRTAVWLRSPGMLSAPKELLQVATELQLRARP